MCGGEVGEEVGVPFVITFLFSRPLVGLLFQTCVCVHSCFS